MIQRRHHEASEILLILYGSYPNCIIRNSFKTRVFLWLEQMLMGPSGEDGHPQTPKINGRSAEDKDEDVLLIVAYLPHG